MTGSNWTFERSSGYAGHRCKCGHWEYEMRLEKHRCIFTSSALEGKTITELAIGYRRYEALRKLNAREFSELCQRNLKGENFDQMVDDLS
jgi:hypothetical protein